MDPQVDKKFDLRNAFCGIWESLKKTRKRDDRKLEKGFFFFFFFSVVLGLPEILLGLLSPFSTY